jgi:cbb3-type cytochrome oxidase subunit 3
MDPILLLALVWFVVLPIAVIVWAYFAGERIERREDAERKARIEERFR